MWGAPLTRSDCGCCSDWRCQTWAVGGGLPLFHAFRRIIIIITKCPLNLRYSLIKYHMTNEFIGFVINMSKLLSVVQRVWVSTNSKMEAVSKAALRKEIADTVGALPKEEIKRQSAIVVQKLFALKEFKESKRVSVYLSLDTEIDTEPIVRRLFEDGKNCYVPRYSKAGMQMVRLLSMEDWENLPVTKWNIKQPALKEERENALETGGLDLIVVPGVAFTKEGLRMGHGGGYYDKYMAKCKKDQRKAPALIAVALKEQVLDYVPTTETDVIVDKVLYAE